LTLSLLLSKYGIRSHIIEKETEIIDHPRAHFINTRTMEIFRSLGIDHEVYDCVRPLHEWRKFKYCTSVLGDENVVDIGETDHFSSDFYFQDVDDNNNKKNLYTELKKNSPSPVANLSQAKLTKILYNNVKENNNVSNNNNIDDNYDKQLGTIDMGMEVESISFDNNNNNTSSSNTKMNNGHSIINVISRVNNNNNNNDKTDGNNNNEKQRAIQCNYLIGADGAGSMVRQALNIELNGIPNMQ